MEPNETPVFISYSRKDKELVASCVELLCSTGAKVFRDEDSIPKGAEWRPFIEESISNARVVLVFWCIHSRRSLEVAMEWKQAVREKKR